MNLRKRRPEPRGAVPDLSRWVAAELAGRGSSDEQFRALMVGLPRASVPRGFEAQVMARVGFAGASNDGWSAGLRFAARVAFVVFAVLVTWYGAVALTPWTASRFVGFLNFSARGFVSVVQAADGGVDAWTILARAGRALGTVIATPRVTAMFVGVELIGVAVLYGLHRLLKIEKETTQW